MSATVMLWAVLALNTNTGDYSLSSSTYETQKACIKSISDASKPDFPAATIYQCVTISKKDHTNYVRDTNDWARISSTTKKY